MSVTTAPKSPVTFGGIEKRILNEARNLGAANAISERLGQEPEVGRGQFLSTAKKELGSENLSQQDLNNILVAVGRSYDDGARETHKANAILSRQSLHSED